MLINCFFEINISFIDISCLSRNVQNILKNVRGHKRPTDIFSSAIDNINFHLDKLIIE